MKHLNDELLADYVLGILEPKEISVVQSHLKTCYICREKANQLEETYINLAETSTPVAPSPQIWQKISEKVTKTSKKILWFHRPQTAWVAAASLLLVCLGLSWALIIFSGRQNEILAEQRLIKEWIYRPDLNLTSLNDDRGQIVGTLLIQGNGKALVILRDLPPNGSIYQAWGINTSIVNESKVNATSLGTFDGRMIEINWQGFEKFGLSIEPPGGSPQPTNILSQAVFVKI